ncbi:IclR family transcriptional regulator [Microbacterium sp. MPKO10]|uniref:IclR family transcriptional regulator n=1 Tax=Microbacterium sp. MPKO10 TaxID=2989818 RepID=UPI00223658DD|nr:IclR family transcriptional regulator [Microbacterium sp. MPKO10]MCW4459946.1 IclR family transcriptional regulator [Microbacterium sp. MPKO10]
MADDDGSIDRALALLALFGESERWRAEDLASSLSLPVSTVYRMLGKLTLRGLVQRNHGATYSAGAAVVPLAERYRERSLMQTAISARLDRLTEDTGEFAAFMVAHGSHALCVEVSEGTRVLRCSYTKGATQPLVRGATALALLAHVSDEARRAAYDEHGLDAAAIAALEAAQEKARTDGVAISQGELDEGVWGASSVVRDVAQNVVGTVTVMAPVDRATQRGAHYVQMVRQAARELSGGAA